MSKPVILFESYPDFNGSALAVYEELVKRGYEEKYDLVWAVYSNFNLKTDYKVVKFFNCNSPEKQDIIRRTKCIIDSNRFIPKFSNDVFRFHVRHGLTLKDSRFYVRSAGALDYVITTSEEMKKLDQALWPDYFKDKFVITGMPSEDKIFHPKDLYAGFIQELTETNKKFKKIISWLPTYRDHRCSHFGKNRFPYGLPGIHSTDEYNKLNDALKKNDILLLVQMHHAQAKNYHQLPKSSNIVFVNEQIKNKYGLATVDLLGNSNCLLTDYSSAYHEFIILNRPIGLIIEDLVEYSKVQKFFCNYLDWMKGDYLLTNDDLVHWINQIAKEIDESKAEREKSLNKIHKFKDDKSTQRVVDLLVEKAKI